MIVNQLHEAQSTLHDIPSEQMSIITGGLFNPAIASIMATEHHPDDRLSVVTFLWGTVMYFDDRDHASITEPLEPGSTTPMRWRPLSELYRTR